ncbi:hypothetical protein RB594_006562 [Gaeumannomyces avenae]
MEQLPGDRISGATDRVSKAAANVMRLLKVPIKDLINPLHFNSSGLSVNTSETLAFAAKKLSDPEALTASGMSDLTALVSRFKEVLFECCQRRGPAVYVNSKDIYGALGKLNLARHQPNKKRRMDDGHEPSEDQQCITRQLLYARQNLQKCQDISTQTFTEYSLACSQLNTARSALDSAKSSVHATDSHHLNTINEMELSIARTERLITSLEDLAREIPELGGETIDKYKEILNAKTTELKQFTFAVEAAKLDLRNAENAHEWAKQAMYAAEEATNTANSENDCCKISLICWSVCAGGVKRLGQWSHEHPGEFRLLADAAGAIMTLDSGRGLRPEFD